MKVSALTIMLSGILLAAATASAGQPFLECCACQAEGPPSIPALFCAEVLSEEEELSFENRCSDVSGNTTCVPIVPGAQSLVEDDVNCSVLLSIQGINCPGSASAPVPLLGPGVLVGLAVALAGLGAWVVRRRGSASSAR